MSTVEDDQCKTGHHGALCGACDKGYDYELGRNRCTQCVEFLDMMERTAIQCVGVIIILALIIFLVAYMYHRDFPLLTVFCVFLRDNAKSGVNSGGDFGVVEDVVTMTVRDDETKDSDEGSSDSEAATRDAAVKQARQKSLQRSLLTKLYVFPVVDDVLCRKIIVAAWQIGSSAETIFRQIRFPPVFTKLTEMFGVLGFAVIDVGSSKCLLNWSTSCHCFHDVTFAGYFDKLVFVTLAPFGAIALGSGIYGYVNRRTERKKVFANLTYATLLFLYVILPSISTYVITYFSSGNPVPKLLWTVIDVQQVHSIRPRGRPEGHEGHRVGAKHPVSREKI